MRHIRIVLLAGAVFYARPAIAADALKFGPPPAWVHPLPIPAAKPTDAPIALLLHDQQIAFDRGKITTYSEAAIKIENAQGLAAGNVALVWQPATDTLTVNKLQIRRGDKVIDVLASGQTFTVLRRETNLDAATLDGTLTATLQPEGLQEGDIIDLGTTTERIDPVLKGHVEAVFGAWDGLPIQEAHAELSWPSDRHVNLRETSSLPALQRSSAKGVNEIEFSAKDVQPIVAPKGAPDRFKIGRLAEATDFASWSDLANLMIPLFHDAAVIPSAGPLHDEVERIRASTLDPKARAAQALALVQNRVRYVALLMGQGSYVPASAEQTWARRFGDCKAKTALLLGILQSLGIEAEPVLVQVKGGDMIAERLPMIALFNHVLVRARVNGKDYWLDGTRTGDTDLDAIEIPDFGWGLPVVEHAALVHLAPQPLTKPQSEVRLDIDASAGVYASAPTTADQILRGDAAVEMATLLSSASAAQQQQFFDTYWKASFDFINMKSASFTFDKTKRELHLTMTGSAKLDWSGGYFHLPNSSVGYHPDFDRQPGPTQNAPFGVDYPSYKKWIIQLRVPPSFLNARKRGSADIHESLAGVEYNRTSTLSADTITVETSARSVASEIAYKDAKAAEARLLALDDEDVSIPLSDTYRLTSADLAAMAKDQPESSDGLVTRGNTLMDNQIYDEAIADFTKALSIDANNADALADRGMAYVSLRKKDLANKDIDAALSIEPDNATAYRARGLDAELNFDCASAIQAYTKSLRRETDNAFAIGHRALCEHFIGQDQNALDDSVRALVLFPNWVQLRTLRGNIFVAQGKVDSAAKEAALLVEQDPKSIDALVEAGRIYARIGKPADSAKAFDAALTINPDAETYIIRSRWLPPSDRVGRTADLLAALKLKPDNVDYLAEEAEEFALQGDYKQALQLYDRLVNPSVAFSEFAAAQAAVFYKAGKVAAANRIFAAERHKAKTAAELTKLCFIKAVADILLDEALKDCRDALQLAPNDALANANLGFVLLRLGRFSDAVDQYAKAITEKTDAAAYMGRAVAYSGEGNALHAKMDRSSALELNPDAEILFAEYGLKLDEPSPPTTVASQAAGKK